MGAKKATAESRGAREAVPVRLEALAAFAKRMQAEGARLQGILEYAREMGHETLEVKNIPSFEHGIEQVASFISAVTKATSEATLRAPFQEQLAQIRKRKK